MTGARVAEFKLVSTAVVQTGYNQVIEMSSNDVWGLREGAY